MKPAGISRLWCSCPRSMGRKKDRNSMRWFSSLSSNFLSHGQKLQMEKHVLLEVKQRLTIKVKVPDVVPQCTTTHSRSQQRQGQDDAASCQVLTSIPNPQLHVYVCKSKVYVYTNFFINQTTCSVNTHECNHDHTYHKFTYIYIYLFIYLFI